MAAAIDNAAVDIAGQPAPDDVWACIARSYASFTSPMVPCEEDIRAYERVAAHHAARIEGDWFNVVMLGVTPGIACMQWPMHTRLLAIDASPAVIHALWPGDIPGQRQSLCASWFEMPVAPQSCN